MTDWIKASNPTAPISTETEALAAARASAVAIFLGVVWGIVGIVYLMTSGQAIMDAAVAQASADSPEAAGMAGMMAQGVVWMAGLFVVCQLVLGFVQWAKPNIVIPIIFLILVAFGLLSGIPAVMGMGQADVPDEFRAPAWQTWLGLIILIVQLIMHIAGIRGARALDKIRMAAAQ